MHGHAHSVTPVLLIVIAVVVLGGIALMARNRAPRRPSVQEQRASGLLARLEDMPTVQLHDLFARLADSTTEQQDWLEEVLDELEQIPETDGYSPDAE
jgi:hypothetical protein